MPAPATPMAFPRRRALPLGLLAGAASVLPARAVAQAFNLPQLNLPPLADLPLGEPLLQLGLAAGGLLGLVLGGLVFYLLGRGAGHAQAERVLLPSLDAARDEATRLAGALDAARAQAAAAVARAATPAPSLAARFREALVNLSQLAERLGDNAGKAASQASQAETAAGAAAGALGSRTIALADMARDAQELAGQVAAMRTCLEAIAAALAAEPAADETTPEPDSATATAEAPPGMSLLQQARAAGTTATALATALRQQAALAAPTAAEVARISAEVTRWTRAAEAMVVTSGMVAVEAAAVAEAMGAVVLAEPAPAEDAPGPGPRPISLANLRAAMAPKPGGQ